MGLLEVMTMDLIRVMAKDLLGVTMDLLGVTTEHLVGRIG